MSPTLLDYFFDPILQAPTIGSILMCLAASLVGVVIFLQKESLIGECLSHASYPGVIIGGMVVYLTLGVIPESPFFAFAVLVGAFFAAFSALFTVKFLQKYLRVKSDAALCFVLSSFFGIGVLLSSYLQFSYPKLYRQSIVYLYGQAATMRFVHVQIYAALAALIICAIALFYKEIKMLAFDRLYAKSQGIPVFLLDLLLSVLTTMAIVVGIRSVGVILISSMLIAPPVAARQYTQKLSTMFFLSAFFGALSGFLGNYLSFELSYLFSSGGKKLVLPTGPVIVLVSTIICLFSLLFAKERGIFLRFWRMAKFRRRCLAENLLKSIWRMRSNQELISIEKLCEKESVSSYYLKFVLWRLKCYGWLRFCKGDIVCLTKDGEDLAKKIVRLHRLWEVYLVEYLEVGKERVHCSAEEMEHILTRELEEELTELLEDPKKDPHKQPIPPKTGV